MLHSLHLMRSWLLDANKRNLNNHCFKMQEKAALNRILYRARKR